MVHHIGLPPWSNERDRLRDRKRIVAGERSLASFGIAGEEIIRGHVVSKFVTFGPKREVFGRLRTRERDRGDIRRDRTKCVSIDRMDLDAAAILSGVLVK